MLLTERWVFEACPAYEELLIIRSFHTISLLMNWSSLVHRLMSIGIQVADRIFVHVLYCIDVLMSWMSFVCPDVYYCESLVFWSAHLSELTLHYKNNFYWWTCESCISLGIPLQFYQRTFLHFSHSIPYLSVTLCEEFSEWLVVCWVSEFESLTDTFLVYTFVYDGWTHQHCWFICIEWTWFVEEPILSVW